MYETCWQLHPQLDKYNLSGTSVAMCLALPRWMLSRTYNAAVPAFARSVPGSDVKSGAVGSSESERQGQLVLQQRHDCPETHSMHTCLPTSYDVLCLCGQS